MPDLRRRVQVSVTGRRDVERMTVALRDFLGLGRSAPSQAGEAAQRYGRDAARGYGQGARGADEARASHRRLADEVGRSTPTAARDVGVLTAAYQRLRAAVAGLAVGVAFRWAFRANADLEQFRISLATALGDAERAERTLKSLFEFAATTPFQFNEVMEASRVALGFRIEAEKLEPTLRRLGDVAAGTHTPLRELVIVYGQVRQKGQLYSEELLQFAERGVPVLSELAAMLGKSEAETRKLVEEGRVGFPHLEEVFRRLTAEGGQFAGLMEKQSRSARGLISTLADLATAGAREVTGAAFEALRDDLAALTDEAKRLHDSGELASWGKRAGEGLRTFYEQVKAAIGFIREHGTALLWLGGVYVTLRGFVGGAALLVSGWHTLLKGGRAVIAAYQATMLLLEAAYAAVRGQTIAASVAMVGFNRIVRAHPLGLLAAGLSAAVGAFLAFRSRADEVTEALQEQRRQVVGLVADLRTLSGAAARQQERVLERERRGNQGQYGQVTGQIDVLRGIRGGTRLFTLSDEDRARLMRAGMSEEGVAGLVNDAGLTSRQRIEGVINGLLRERRELNEQDVALNTAITRSQREHSHEVGYRIEREREVLEALKAHASVNEDLEAQARRREAIAASEARIARLEAQVSAPADAGGVPELLPGREPKGKTPEQLAREEERLEEQRERARRQLQEIAAATRAAAGVSEAYRAALERQAEVEAEVLRLQHDREELVSRGGEGATATVDARIAQLRREAAALEKLTALMPDGRANVDVAEAMGKAAAEARELAEALREDGEAMDRLRHLAGKSAEAAERLARVAPMLDAVKGGLGTLTPLFDLGFEGEMTRDVEVAADRAKGDWERRAELLVVAKQAADGYARSVERLRLEHERGAIGEDEYARRVGESADAVREAVRHVAGALEALGLMTPETREALGGMFDDAAKGGTRAAAETAKLVRELEATRSLVGDVRGLFEALGAVSLSRLVGGLEDALGAMGRLAEARAAYAAAEASGGATVAQGMAVAGGYLAVVTSVVSAVGGFINAIEAARERQRELEEAVEDSARAMRENTRALLEEGQIGRDVRPEDAALAARELGGLGAAPSQNPLDYDMPLTPGGPLPSPDQGGDMRDAAWRRYAGEVDDAFERMADAGLEVTDLEAALAAAIEAEDWAAVAEVVEEARRRFGDLNESLGQYSDDFRGQMARWEDTQRYLGLEGQEAFRAFLDMMRSLDLGPEWARILGELEGIDISTPEGQAQRDAVIAAAFEYFQSHPELFPEGMTPDDLKAFFDMALGFDGGPAGGSESQGVAAVRSVTEVQGNELLAYQQELLRAARDANVLLAEIAAGMAAPFSGDGAPGTAPGGPKVTVDGVYVDARAALTRDEIRGIAAETSAEVERKLLRAVTPTRSSRG